MKKILIVAAVIIILMAGCKAQEITGGNIHIQNKQYDKAIEQFKLATQKYPNMAEPFVSLSVPYFLKRNYVEAAENLIKALNINREEAEKKIKWYEDFIGTNDYDWQVFYNAAVTASQKGNTEKSLEYVEYSEETETLEAKSLSFNLHGNIYANMNDIDKARGYYEKAIETYKNHIDPYLSLGRLYIIKENSDKAIEYFEKAIAIDSTQTQTYTYLGQAYLNTEQFDKAIEVLEKASQVFKSNPKILYNLALSYLQNDNYEMAVNKGTELLELEDVDPEIKSLTYNLVGLAYINNEQYKKAVDVLHEAVEYNPNNCEAYQRLSLAYYKLNNTQMASEFGTKYDECMKQ